MIGKKNSSLTWLWLSILVIVIDQLTKYWVAHKFWVGFSWSVTPFFALTLLHNQGAAFNFLSNIGITAVWIFSIVAVIIGLLIIVWLANLPAKQTWQACALSLILGGALGNLIDRIVHGYVIDFILLHYKQYAWPAFNIADTAITIGAIILAITLVAKNKR